VISSPEALSNTSESTFSQEPTREVSPAGDDFSGAEIPQFGALDIVNAFTAMRHEWRGQTKESRALAEQIQQAVASLESLEAQRHAAYDDPESPEAAEARQLVLLIAETDHQLSRAVSAIALWESNRQRREAAEAEAVERQIAAMSPLAKWFASPLLALLTGQHSARQPAQDHPALDGLNMVLARLRRMMNEQEIQRLDVLGEPFDAETMHAIGTVTTPDYAPGYVAEQLSPAYSWQDQLLRFADVRVADEKKVQVKHKGN
jgi:molecular chaperone GrpE